MSVIKGIQELAAKYFDQTVACRRHLHQYPELSFNEIETSNYVASQLDQLGITYKRGIGGHGLVGEIQGESDNGKVTALRADMDALPIQETNEVSYKSQNSGVMHACGHDVHTSSLLGCARILSKIRSRFGGTVKLIFQPAEERLPGGASLMIKDGVLLNPEPRSIFGQHVHPPLETGKVGFRPGIYMASADEIFLTIKGKGGHAALPHDTIDPLVILSNVILGLQGIVSRNANPTIPTVLSFGKVNSDGGATNIIPDRIMLEGTFRTLDEDWRKRAHELIRKTATSIALGMGGTAEIDIKVGYPCLTNNEMLTQKAMSAAINYLGPENVVELPVRLTAEDFAYYTLHTDACFYRLGTGNAEKGITSPVHTSSFDVDEDCLEVGSGLMSYLAIQELT
ncbi:MAG: amidohydrolase [Bacteroidia bacterium]|nr:amidohydrolase [Bacteroidia bacterium]